MPNELVEGETESKTLESFEIFCKVDLQLADSTTSRYVREIERFLESVERDPLDVSRDDIRTYLIRFKEMSDSAYGNVLRPLKIYFREFLGLSDKFLVSGFLGEPSNLGEFQIKKRSNDFMNLWIRFEIEPCS